MYATEKKVNETVAIMKAAGTEMPMPRPESGSLNIIAASGAEPVTMQNRICGSPSAFRASSVDPVTPLAAGAGALVASMQSPFGLDPSRPRVVEAGGEAYDLEAGGATSFGDFCMNALPWDDPARGCFANHARVGHRRHIGNRVRD